MQKITHDEKSGFLYGSSTNISQSTKTTINILDQFREHKSVQPSTQKFNMSSSMKFTKLDKLMNQQDYVQWRRRFRGVIQRDDPGMMALKDAPEEAVDNFDECVTANP